MSKIFKIILITITTTLATACATTSDITIVQVQIDGLTNQLERTNTLIHEASVSTSKALESTNQASVSATNAAMLNEIINTRISKLIVSQ